MGHSFLWCLCCRDNFHPLGLTLETFQYKKYFWLFWCNGATTSGESMLCTVLCTRITFTNLNITIYGSQMNFRPTNRILDLSVESTANHLKKNALKMEISLDKNKND